MAFVSISAARLDIEYQEKKHEITLVFLDYRSVILDIPCKLNTGNLHMRDCQARCSGSKVEGGGAVEQEWRGGDESRTERGTALAFKFVYELSMVSKVI